ARHHARVDDAERDPHGPIVENEGLRAEEVDHAAPGPLLEHRVDEDPNRLGRDVDGCGAGAEDLFLAALDGKRSSEQRAVRGHDHGGCPHASLLDLFHPPTPAPALPAPMSAPSAHMITVQPT